MEEQQNITTGELVLNSCIAISKVRKFIGYRNMLKRFSVIPDTVYGTIAEGIHVLGNHSHVNSVPIYSSALPSEYPAVLLKYDQDCIFALVNSMRNDEIVSLPLNTKPKDFNSLKVGENISAGERVYFSTRDAENLNSLLMATAEMAFRHNLISQDTLDMDKELVGLKEFSHT